MDLKDVKTIIQWLGRLPVKDGWLSIGDTEVYYLKASSIDGGFYGMLAIRTGRDPIIISEKEL